MFKQYYFVYCETGKNLLKIYESLVLSHHFTALKVYSVFSNVLVMLDLQQTNTKQQQQQQQNNRQNW